MKKRLFSFMICLFLFVSWFTVLIKGQAQAGGGIVEVEINPNGTYLRAVNWYPQWGPGPTDLTPTIVDLGAHGLSPGDLIVISYSGNWSYNAGWGNPNPHYAEAENVHLLALFSSTSSISAVTNLNRVTGAIDFGEDYVTRNTWWEETLQKRNDDGTYNPPLKGGNQPTDIPEDFRITPHTGMEIKIPNNAKFLMFAFSARYPPTSAGNIKVNIEKDSDGDGLPDSWEKNGIYIDDDDTVDLDLPALGARWDRKDIFVEIDYMGASGAHDHKPDDDAIRDVIDAFDRAPVSNPGPDGITLHVLVDNSEVIPHQNEINIWTDFDRLKSLGTQADKNNGNKENILEAKKLVYHYCMFIHLMKGSLSSGKAEIRGNDFVVSLADFTDETGNREEQAGTFMHELGHNLGLLHGGSDSTHYKPNYLSVMNYLFQIPSETSTLFTRPLTFSSSRLEDLEENDLDERKGIGITPWPVTVYSGKLQTTTGTTYVPVAVTTSSRIDWNNNGDENETNVAANINNFPNWDYNSPGGETLTGFNDYANLEFNFRAYSDFADGVHLNDTDQEITMEIVEAIRESTKNLNVINSTPILIDSDGTAEDSVVTIEILSLALVLIIIILIVIFYWRKRKQS